MTTRPATREVIRDFAAVVFGVVAAIVALLLLVTAAAAWIAGLVIGLILQTRYRLAFHLLVDACIAWVIAGWLHRWSIRTHERFKARDAARAEERRRREVWRAAGLTGDPPPVT